jgi:hypothetical protein
MTKDEVNPNDEAGMIQRGFVRFRNSCFVNVSSFACHAEARRRWVIRLPRRSPAQAGHSSF